MTQNQTVRELMPLTSISRRAIVLITTMALLLAVACSRKDADTASTDAVAVANAAITTVYAGGDILTMAGREPAYAEALAVREGKILAVGTRAVLAKGGHGEGAHSEDVLWAAGERRSYARLRLPTGRVRGTLVPQPGK